MDFFPYDLVTVNDCLSDTLEKGNTLSRVKQIIPANYANLQTIHKDNLNKLIFHINPE